ncbi:MAG: DUF202 domain-containing protein [Actinomycetes bacterium]
MIGPHSDGLEPGQEPDYRFSLANERTFLAYLRTALALDAAGLATVQFLTDVATPETRRVAGAALTAAGLVAAVAGYRRWRANQEAMRHGRALPPSSVPLTLAAAVAVASAVALVLALAG